MGVQLYHSAPSKSRCESEAVQEYSPQDTHTRTSTHTHTHHCTGMAFIDVMHYPAATLTLTKPSDPHTQEWANIVPKGSGDPGKTVVYR